LIAEDQDRDEYCQGREQQHEKPGHQDRSPTCPVEAARPRQRPKARQARTYPVDPVLLVVRADRDALRRQRCNLHGVEDPHSLRRGSRRTVVGQRRPRGDKTVVGRNRIVAAAVFAAEPTSVLSMAAPCEHRVDVQPIDLARQTSPRRRIRGCTLG
jgi:hypothetical protein